MTGKKALFILCCYLSLGSPLITAPEEVKNGVILDKVVCRQSPNHSYALYLPTGYSPDKSWPILYALDPAARGKVPVERFAQAAEKYQVIVAGSNGARNGPWGAIFSAVIAMWEDTRFRFSIDPRQITVAGFSGGSRAASMFMRITGQPVAAIMACGAGLAAELSPSDTRPAFYHGVVGYEDFNYQEMMGLEEKLQEKGLPHRFLVFDGPHNWPPPEICRRVLGWIVCRAMVQGLRPNEEKTVQEVFGAELEAARTLEASGRIVQAVKDYEALAAAFKGLAEPLGLQAKIDQLKRGPDFAKALKKERSLGEQEKRFVDTYRSVLVSIERNPPDPAELYQMLFDLGLGGLTKKAEKSDWPEEKAMARRLLTGLEIEAREKGYEYYGRQDARRSIPFFEVATKAGGPFQTWRRVNHFNLACAHALAGHTKDALANIRKAIENGLTDPELLEKEEAFQSLFQNQDFQKILKSLREKNKR
jgi:tetratricopeptide (TPR) repeat protein